jgi:hypothetical protein
MLARITCQPSIIHARPMVVRTFPHIAMRERRPEMARAQPLLWQAGLPERREVLRGDHSEPESGWSQAKPGNQGHRVC